MITTSKFDSGLIDMSFVINEVGFVILPFVRGLNDLFLIESNCRRWWAI